jgi:acyl dehydratase
MNSPRIYYEDFEVGATLRFGRHEVTKEAIIAYAREFDPQPMHLDEEAAKGSLLGGLAASGWHVCAMMMRMCWDGFIHETASMGSPGIEEVRWMRPVRPGHILSLERTVLDKRRSESRADMGLVKFRFDLFAQDGERLGRMENWYMVGVREPGARNDGSTGSP